jgi:hypothetical protein
MNYPGNPRFRPSCVFKVADTTEEMNQRCRLLMDRAIIITEEGPMGVRSREELKDIIQHHLGISKHEFYVYHSSLNHLLLSFMIKGIEILFLLRVA